MRAVGEALEFPLQRSRTRWSAERSGAGGERALAKIASTEPHSLECGEAEHGGHVFACQVGFNGAALVGVRRAGRREVRGVLQASLQRSRTRWSAESAPRKRNLHVYESCFNGAALVGVRRDDSTISQLLAVYASTEPHSLECGEC